MVSGLLREADKRIRRLTVLHPLIRFPSAGHPFPPTDTPAEILNPSQWGKIAIWQYSLEPKLKQV